MERAMIETIVNVTDYRGPATLCLKKIGCDLCPTSCVYYDRLKKGPEAEELRRTYLLMRAEHRERKVAILSAVAAGRDHLAAAERFNLGVDVVAFYVTRDAYNARRRVDAVARRAGT
jgi:hypothetical protein